MQVSVIGAGLAGCEAAWQLARRGIAVTLYEMKPAKRTPAHHSDDFAELCCSNSLRSDQLENAVGLLKEELRRLGSLILACADETRVEAGGALAVDRHGFARLVTERVRSHPNITVIESEVTSIPAEGTVIVASGPLTSDALSAAIADGLSNFQISSAYRTYSEQQKLVDNSVAKYQKNNPDWSRDRCLSATYNTVAPAGTSEHQTGLAFDITVPNVSFTGTAQQKWLHEHCAKYGFVVRFTADKQKLTGFVAESWHFRYVGVEAAQTMTQNNWCLEEYVEKMGL